MIVGHGHISWKSMGLLGLGMNRSNLSARETTSAHMHKCNHSMGRWHHQLSKLKKIPIIFVFDMKNFMVEKSFCTYLAGCLSDSETGCLNISGC